MEDMEQKKQQAAAVLELLKISKEKATDELLEKAKKLEARAKMSAVEQLEDMAKDRDPYADSKMQQTFPTIKNVVAIKGKILIIVDELYATKLALEEAVNVLGVLAKPQDIMEYVESHKNRTTLLTVGKFMRNISNLLYLAKNHPDMFGSGTGGGPLKDFMEAARAAIKEAHDYLVKNFGNDVGDVPATELGFNVPETTNLQEFARILGEDWEEALTPEQHFNLFGSLLRDKSPVTGRRNQR